MIFDGSFGVKKGSVGSGVYYEKLNGWSEGDGWRRNNDFNQKGSFLKRFARTFLFTCSRKVQNYKQSTNSTFRSRKEKIRVNDTKPVQCSKPEMMYQ